MKTYLFFLLVWGLGSCVSSTPDFSLTLGPSSEKTNRLEEKALKAPPASRALEQVRIDYLLERVAKSPYNFIRNGETHSAKRAWAHLKWKYLINMSRIKTAEEFIEEVASYSKMSGETYLIEFPDKTRHPLRSLLMNELRLFDQGVEAKRKSAAETPSSPQSS